MVVLLVLNFQTIVGTVVVYFFKLQKIVMRQLKREDIDADVEIIVKPYEAFLLSKGFKFVSTIEHNSMIEKFDKTYHIYYYYHDDLGVHALLQTTPYQEAIGNATISFATFYESYNMAFSYDCFAHNVVLPDEMYLFDHYHGSFEKAFASHLIDREIEGEVIVKEVLSEEGFKSYNEFMLEASITEMFNRNILTERGDGYKFVFSMGFLKHMHRSVKGHKKSKSIVSKSNNATTPFLESKSYQALYQNSEEKSILRGLEEKPTPSNSKDKMRTFFLSGLGFVLFFGLIGIPWSSLPIIIAVLLIHELGHFFAMKYFGYQDTSIFFIPLFGAAAKGEKEYVRSFEEYIVFLAGPLPGMLIGIAIGIMMLSSPELRDNGLLKEYAIMSFVLNYVNLLPIYPLDGGKIVQTLLFTRYPKLQYYFFLVSLTVIIGSALLLQSLLLGLFAVALFLSINHNANLAKLLEMLNAENSNDNIRERAVKMVTTNSTFEKVSLARKNALVKQSVKLLNAEKPSKLLIFVGMGIYLLLVAPPLVIGVLLGSI